MVTTKKTPKKVIKTPRARKAKKTTKKTYVAIVLDRSGSMASIRKETVGGLNEQFAVLRENAKLGCETEVTLIQFDNVIDVLVKGSTPADIKDWSFDDFQPRGGTAMYDAVWAAINTLKTKEETDDTGFLVCVLSDGEENSSKEITQLALSNEIKKLQDTGKWTFTYMLANQDIHAVSKNIGVNIGNMSSFVANAAGVSGSYTMSNSALRGYMGARNAGTLSVNNFYANTFVEDSTK